MPLHVSGWSLEQEGKPVACLKISGFASLPSEKVTFVDAPRARWPASPRAMIDHPEAAEQERIQAGKGHLGHPLLGSDDEEKGFIQIRLNLGEHHPYFALALAGWGMQYHSAGKDALAEKLLKQAIDVSQASLGPLHPDHALIVSSLGEVYRDMGRFDRAQPLLTQAARINAEVFGAPRRIARPSGRRLRSIRIWGACRGQTSLRKAVEASSNAPPLERANALFALGELDFRIGEHEKAVALLAQAHALLETEIQRIRKEQRHMGGTELLRVCLAKTMAERRASVQLKKKSEARQLARAAFLAMCQFHSGRDPNWPGRFLGWNGPIRNVLPNQLLTVDPSYRRVMITLAELFVALGDDDPAGGCLQVLDIAPGQTHHDLAAVYRIMRKVRELSPTGPVTSYLEPSRVPDRYKREFEYNWRVRNLKPGDQLPTPDMYWLQLAIQEYERSVGRDHPETLEALQNLAQKSGDLTVRKKPRQLCTTPGAGRLIS